MPICRFAHLNSNFDKGISNKIYNSFAPFATLGGVPPFCSPQFGRNARLNGTPLCCRHPAQRRPVPVRRWEDCGMCLRVHCVRMWSGCIGNAFRCRSFYSLVSLRESWIGHAVWKIASDFSSVPSYGKIAKAIFGNPTKKRWVWIPGLKIASTNTSTAACFLEEATDWRSYSWKGINWASTNWAEQWKNRLFRVYWGLYYPDI